MDSQITADNAKMKQAFNLFDRDGDGKISQTELGEVLATVGQKMSDADLRSLIGGSVEGMFTARGGAIDFDTFMQIVTGQIKGGKSEKLGSEITDLQEAFILLDREGKGYIKEAELIKVCEKLGCPLTEEQAAAMVGEALIGYEGKIYYDGLLKILITQ